ncbi:AGAP003213-PA-like protein [Anopheles sinensis]|uniref:AGAP003213-PA-like protein n=1 Tax=Anopheles sinensis TaxID=74873 RepID=A0A084WSK8_ANOSI|nr:AGAP003213-PA-like protein [Anopheles sinensis]
MWYLTNKKTQHVYYLVAQPSGHTVGRVKTDLVISDDDSISRQHAMLLPDKDVIKLTDTGSRYGTYVNGNIAKIVCISKDQPTELKEGDMVQFGRCGSLWTVGRVSFRCLTSTLVMSNDLKALLQKLQAEVLPAFAGGVTHLIMPTITVTTKLLMCLVAQVPIVTPAYFEAVGECVAQGKSLPPVTDFVPTCTESDIKNDPRMFQPKAARCDLFKGREFIFLSTKQSEQYEDIIKQAGGVCLSAQRERIAKTRFVKPNVVTIKLKESGSSQSQSQSLDSLDKQFTARGLRMIPEMEIGLAVLYGSTEKYCNPSYKFAFNVEVCDEPEPVGTEDILAKNSMNSETVGVRKRVKIEQNTIPETELNTERTEKATTSSSTMRNDVEFSCPKPSEPIASSSIPEPSGLRRSKRFPEKETSEGQVTHADKDTFQEPKRPRRATPTSPSKSIPKAIPSEVQRNETPVTSVSDTVPVESAPQVVSSQPIAPIGFQAVNRKQPETDRPTSSTRASTRRRANILLQAEDDDLFNFDEIAPRKKPRTTVSTAVASTPKDNPQSSAGDEDDLFSMDDNLPSQRRRGTNSRRPLPASSGSPAPESNKTPPTGTTDVTTVSQKSNQTNSGSISARFRAFMKPIENSNASWLSSSMCALKLDANGDDDHQSSSTLSSSVKIKQEPQDSTDGVNNGTVAAEDKRWIAGMSNIFQVQERSMKLVAHLPPTLNDMLAGQERSLGLPNGVRNFKAFVKKRNYKGQQTCFPLKLVCALDESQAA